MKAIIHFANDPSVGWFPETYEMQLPDIEALTEMEWDREMIRQEIQNAYFLINGENNSCKVWFSDERHDYF